MLLIRTLLHNEDGQGLIEYGLLLALMVIIVIGVLFVYQNSLNNTLNNLLNEVNAVIDSIFA